MKTITKISAALFGCMLAVSCDTGLSNEELGVVDNSGNGRLNPANVYIRQEQVQKIHGQNILDYTFNNEGFLTGVIYDGQSPRAAPERFLFQPFRLRYSHSDRIHNGQRQ